MSHSTRWLAVVAGLLLAWAGQGEEVLLPGQLRLHASFDGTRAAVGANGVAVLPTRWRHASFASHYTEGAYVDGPFGQALTGRNTVGWYPAAGQLDPARGTVAFHFKVDGMAGGYEPFLIRTVDPYYWYRYLRVEVHKSGETLAVSFPDELYRPLTVYPTPGTTLRFNDGAWHHLAICWDQAHGVNVYLDGQLYGSNWGQVSWHSRGVTPDYIHLMNSDQIAYDELYILDVPLAAGEVARLSRQNELPDPLPSASWSDAAAANRRRELSWEPPAGPAIEWQAGEALGLVQVVPKAARAVKKECNAVFDGRLGSGWPPIYNYDYAGGNGLHVQLAEPYDWVFIEGRFQGTVYGEHALLPPGGTSPLATIRSPAFGYWWRLPERRGAGWLSFFKETMETATDDVPDKEQLMRSRIVELSFFRQETPDFTSCDATTESLGPLADAPELQAFGSADRLASADNVDDLRSWREMPALRYVHALVPPPGGQGVIVRGLGLRLLPAIGTPATRLRLEIRDPLLPERRVTALDLRLAETVDATPFVLDLRLPDRLLTPDQYLQISLVSEHPLNLASPPGLVLHTLPAMPLTPAVVDGELNYLKSWFRELSESRPWVGVSAPEEVLSACNPQARQLFAPLVRLHQLAPDEPRVKALWNWTHKDLVDTSPVEPSPVAGCPDAPAWALLQRELLAACQDIHSWWMEHRQTPNGEFGDDWGDDTDLLMDFVKPAMLGDPDGRYARSARLLADGVVREGRLERGINRTATDYLHAYEEGVNAQPVAAMLTRGDPVYLERLMEATATVESYLTGLDAEGRRRFLASSYGSREIVDSARGDTASNALFLHPALGLAWYSRHPAAIRLVREWADAWLHTIATARVGDEKRYPVGLAPDGTPTRWARAFSGFGVADPFLALWQLTGDPAYRIPEALQGGPQPDLGALPALSMLDWTERRGPLLAWANAADLSRPYVDRFGWIARQKLLASELTGEEGPALEALAACLRHLRALRAAYTWGEPIADRIWVPDQPAAAMALGDLPHERNQTWPRHYVSYQELGDFAAWVREKSASHLRLEVYSFQAEPVTGTMRVWQLPPGRYRVSDGTRTNELPLWPGAPLPVTLAPCQSTSIAIDLVSLDDATWWDRPDLAIGEGDGWYNHAGSVTVAVHNLGNRPAANVLIRLLDSDGNTVAEQTLAQIEAPLDLRPRVAVITFPRLPPLAEVEVAIDPGQTIPELRRRNNRLTLRHPYR